MRIVLLTTYYSEGVHVGVSVSACPSQLQDGEGR
jgi:hypothetical protein